MLIIGHKPIIAYLSNIIANNNPVHAYLFYGRKNIGKLSTAIWFAQALMCIKNTKEKPCYSCKSCIAVQKRIHPDFQIITPKKDKTEKVITIDDIRTLQQKVTKTAVYNSYKIIIIKPADELSKEAGHAFLKLLEEPPIKTIFILIAKTKEALLPTIRSRVESIRFSYTSYKEIAETLPELYTNEQKKFIIRISQGRVGIAKILDANVIKKLVEKEKAILQIIKSPLYEKIDFIDKMLKNGEMQLSTITELLRDILLVKVGVDDLIVHNYLKPEYKKLSQKYSLRILYNTLNQLIRFGDEYRQNVNKQLLWQNLLLNMNYEV